MYYSDNTDLLLQTFKIKTNQRCVIITVSIKDCQALSQKNQRLLKIPDIFCKMLDLSDTENYRAKYFMDTKEKLMFRGSCYDLCLWRLYKTLSFPTAKPFLCSIQSGFRKKKSHFYL